MAAIDAAGRQAAQIADDMRFVDKPGLHRYRDFAIFPQALLPFVDEYAAVQRYMVIHFAHPGIMGAQRVDVQRLCRQRPPVKHRRGRCGDGRHNIGIAQGLIWRIDRDDFNAQFSRHFLTEGRPRVGAAAVSIDSLDGAYFRQRIKL